jgi:hypothetical protein
MNEEPREHYRGTFLPVELVRLYEDGTLNAEEIMLLTKIDALQDPEKGCWASNEYLGAWWRKSGRWVRETVSKFEKLGLVEVTQFGDGKRSIRTESRRNKTSRGVEENFPVRRNKTSTKVPFGKERDSASASGGQEGLLNLKGPEDSRPMSYDPPVKLFAEFSRKRGFHLLPPGPSGQVRYKKGAQKGGWTRFKLDHWQRTYAYLLQRQSPETVAKVLEWYLRIYDSDKMVTRVTEFSRFVEEFAKIRQCMIWDQKKQRERDGEEEPVESGASIGPAANVSDEEVEADMERARRFE